MAWTTPPSYTVGELLTAALMNNVSGDLNYLNGYAAPAWYGSGSPTGTASTTAVMAGLGGTWAYTPTLTGNVVVVAGCRGGTATAQTSFTVAGAYGTGTAPSNGAAGTGTAFGDSFVLASGGAAGVSGAAVTITGRITGLSAGTAYWFDLTQLTSSGSDTVTLRSPTALIWEGP